MKFTLEDFKKQYPDIASALKDEGEVAGYKRGVLYTESKRTHEEHSESLPLEEKIKTTWDKNPQIRKEFDGDFEAYMAGEKAIAAGRVKLLGGI